jgi:hypothetical protein
MYVAQCTARLVQHLAQRHFDPFELWQPALPLGVRQCSKQMVPSLVSRGSASRGSSPSCCPTRRRTRRTRRQIRLSVVSMRKWWASTAADLSSSGLLRIALTRRMAVLGDRLDERSRSGIDVAAVGQQDAGILVTRGQLGRNAGPVEQGLG